MFNKIFYTTLIVLISINCIYAFEFTEQNLVKIINDIDNEKSIYIYGGLSLDRKDVDLSIPRHIETISERIERFLKSHEFNFSLKDVAEDEFESGRAVTEANRSRKIKKILLPFLLALKVKMAIVMKVLLMVVKFISLKALATGLLALIFSGATFFKDLLEKKKDHVTTAYITGNPLNAEIVHSDWHRNGQASPQELAYNYHAMGQPAY